MEFFEFENILIRPKDTPSYYGISFTLFLKFPIISISGPVKQIVNEVQSNDVNEKLKGIKSLLKLPDNVFFNIRNVVTSFYCLLKLFCFVSLFEEQLVSRGFTPFCEQGRNLILLLHKVFCRLPSNGLPNSVSFYNFLLCELEEKNRHRVVVVVPFFCSFFFFKPTSRAQLGIWVSLRLAKPWKFFPCAKRKK